MPNTTDKVSSTQNRKSISRGGSYLKRMRLSRGHTLRQVSSALGMSISWVSDVEHGRRGARMDPVVAMLWCEFLSIDPQPLLDSIGITGGQKERRRVRHYLETGQWAHRYIKTQETVARLQKKLAEIREIMGPRDRYVRVYKDDLVDIQDLADACAQLLRVPRKE